MAWQYGRQVWDLLLADIGNEYGVAGIMGNLDAESNIIPYRKQGDFGVGYPESVLYTARVNSGAITEYTFVNDSIGYGLAQWTFSPRKQNLFNACKRTGSVVSIGDCERQVQFLLHELQTEYVNVYNVCRAATSIRQASDIFLHQFENPAVQTPEVEAYREQLGIAIYEEYHGSPPPPPPRTHRKLPIYFYLRPLE